MAHFLLFHPQMRRFLSLVVLLGFTLVAQAVERPITVKEINVMLRGGFSSATIIRELSTRSFAETLNAEQESQLIKSGATPELLNALKGGPKTLPPAQTAKPASPNSTTQRTINPLLARATDYQTSAGHGPSTTFVVVELLVFLLAIAGMWKVFTKAGRPGWASLIPIYNVYVWCKIVGRPGWWVILMLIPFVNIVVGIIVCFDLAKSFGKGAGFGWGIALLGIIFLPILGFGSAQYQGT
jgi:hypothetical protein